MWKVVKVTLLICGVAFAARSDRIYYPDDPILRYAPEIGTSLLQPNSPDYEISIEKIISRGILNLTLTASRITSSLSPDTDSLVFGPTSITGALALILMGSIGSTFDEVANVMGLASGIDIQGRTQTVHEELGKLLDKLVGTSGLDVSDHVNFANGIFVQNDFPIRVAYQRMSELLYKSEVLNVDFGKDPEKTQKIINAWVAERTEGKITSLLDLPPPTYTKLILASVLHFKAAWEQPFIKGLTKWQPFYTNGKNNKADRLAEMMAAGGYYPYFKDNSLNCEIIGFPYKGGKTTMYVIIPNESNKQKVNRLQNILSTDLVERLLANVKKTECIVLFPKMKLESTIDLSEVLFKMGVQSLFDPSRANLILLSPASIHDSHHAKHNPISVPSDGVVIYSRLGEPVNCSNIFNPQSGSNNRCITARGTNNFYNKKTTNVITNPIASLDEIRQQLLSQNVKENPGLYANQILHKVYMDVTETGTEAAAATGVSLTRSGDKVYVRADVPFLFFIRHEQTKIILFWGSVNTPTPSLPNP